MLTRFDAVICTLLGIVTACSFFGLAGNLDAGSQLILARIQSLCALSFLMAGYIAAEYVRGRKALGQERAAEVAQQDKPLLIAALIGLATFALSIVMAFSQDTVAGLVPIATALCLAYAAVMLFHSVAVFKRGGRAFTPQAK